MPITEVPLWLAPVYELNWQIMRIVYLCLEGFGKLKEMPKHEKETFLLYSYMIALSIVFFVWFFGFIP